MPGHARMETTQIHTHVHIDALRDVHARCHPHPHGRNSNETDELPVNGNHQTQEIHRKIAQEVQKKLPKARRNR